MAGLQRKDELRLPSDLRSGRIAAILLVVSVSCIGLMLWWMFQPADLEPSPPQPGPGLTAEVTLRSRPESPSQNYAGSQACAQCHAELSAAYQQHPMGQSMTVAVNVDALSADDGISIERPGPRSYGVRTVDGSMEHWEEWNDPEEQVIYHQSVPVSHAVGSGRRGHSFLVQHGAAIYMSPLSWYTEGNRWDLSPGYRSEEHPRFERRVSEDCLGCHTGRLNTIGNERDRFLAEPFAEASISCERCHGPGKAHVEFHLGGSDGRVDSDPIVNPVDLDPVRRDSVCYQCHLHGLDRILRYGKRESDFRPGERLGDNWVTFVHDSSFNSDHLSEAVSQVEQFNASRCYQASGGKMGCISCHDPHSVPGETQRVNFYREKCLNCHTASDSVCTEEESSRRQRVKDDSCIACHMPRSGASDIPHTSQTDHRIPRVPKPKRSGSAGKPPMEQRSMFVEGGIAPDWEIERAKGLAQAFEAQKSKNQEEAAQALTRLRAIEPQTPDDIENLNAQIPMHLLLGDVSSALEVAERAHQIDPRRESVLDSLVLICDEIGDAEKGLRYADRLLVLNPSSSANHFYRGRCLSQLSRWKEARTSLEESLRLNPLLHVARELLIRVERQAGNPENADRQKKLLSILAS